MWLGCELANTLRIISDLIIRKLIIGFCKLEYTDVTKRKICFHGNE